MRALSASALLCGRNGQNGRFFRLRSADNETFNPNATCDLGCDTTAGFVATVYGSAATYDIPSFGFTYHATGPDLIQREWHNASADQGGNVGDIRSP